MKMIKNIIVMSNKGGVGKTTFAVNLAHSLAESFRVGLLDVDIHGPNVPKMLNLGNKKLGVANNKLVPLKLGNLYIISTAFLLENQNQPLVWRGPIKTKLIKQFIEDVAWPKLDFLVIDLPPGTGDETITIMQSLGKNSGSVIVSTPQMVSLMDAKKAVQVSNEFKIPVIGIVENMSGKIFGSGSVKAFAEKTEINFLGNLDLDKQITLSSNSGQPFVKDKKSNASKQFQHIVNNILEIIKKIKSF